MFLVRIYVKYWFESTIPTLAPKNDLQLIKNLIDYRQINVPVANKVLEVMSRHTWYLSEVLVGLSFFDRDIDIETKRLMVAALSNSSSEEVPKRININTRLVKQQELYDFITENTFEFFRILFVNSSFPIPIEFLSIDPEEWFSNENYKQAEEVVRNLFVVNDVAERTVALAKEFNDKFTKDEDEKQLVFKVLEKHRAEFPTTAKKTIMDKINKSF